MYIRPIAIWLLLVALCVTAYAISVRWDPPISDQPVHVDGTYR